VPKNKKSKTSSLFMQELPVELDVDELDERRNKLVETELKLDALEAERSRTLEGLNNRKTVLVLERKRLLETLNSKTEMRQVECRKEINFDNNQEVITRTDTGERIGERALTGNERSDLAQENFLDGDRPKGGNGAEARE
jgi:hypothetical protein